MVCPEQSARLVGDSSRGKAGLSLVRPWRMTITKPPCFSSSNVARAGCCATEGASCMALPIAVARANKRRFLICTSPSAAHHNERNQIAKSSDGRRRLPRPCHPMTPPTGPYVSPKIDPTKPDGGHPLAEEDWIAAQLHPDLPHPTDTPVTRARRLTAIGQAVVSGHRLTAAVPRKGGGPSAPFPVRWVGNQPAARPAPGLREAAQVRQQRRDGQAGARERPQHPRGLVDRRGPRQHRLPGQLY